VSGAANDVPNTHEPSYYEIALTNRQVIVAFVVLLLCLIAAFFSGVWIGRESGARMAAEQVVRNTPPAEDEKEKKEGQNLEELEFFQSGKKGKPGKGEAKPSAPAPVPTPAAAAPAAQSTAQSTPQSTPKPPQAATGTDATLSNDLGGEDTEAAPRAPAPTPAVPGRGLRQKPSAASPSGAAKPGAAATPPGKPSAKPTATEPAHAAGQVVIQVFSSAEKDQAERIRDRLVSGGEKAYLSPVDVSGRTMYRVRIGPFDSRDKAQKVAEQVRKSYKLDTWVTE